MIKQKKGMSTWAWILIILILIALGVGIYFWFFGKVPSEEISSIASNIQSPPALPE